MATKLKSRRKAKAVEHEAIVNDSPHLHETFEPGDVSMQGDLIIVAIKSLPKSAKPRKDRQLADGNTQGSRHVMTRGDVYDCDPTEVQTAIREVTGCEVGRGYIGPVFVSPENPTENDLHHPEHGAQGMPAGTICAIVFQRSLDQEEREQRVAD